MRLKQPRNVGLTDLWRRRRNRPLVRRFWCERCDFIGIFLRNTLGFRDLTLNVSERCHTLPEIEAFLADAGLRFRGFFPPYLFQLLRQRNPKEPWPGSLERWARLERALLPAHAARRAVARFSKTILPPRQSTLMASFGAKRPSRIAFASGFSSSDWIARLSGRAP